MKTLVLDKSAAEAATGDGLAVLRKRFIFLLTDILLHESYTENINDWEELDESKRVAQFNKIDKNLLKIISEAGDEWLIYGKALSWEINNGCSAKLMPKITLDKIPSVSGIPGQVVKACLDFDRKMGDFLQSKRTQDNNEPYSSLRKLSKAQFFQGMEHDCSTDREINEAVHEAIEYCHRIAKRYDLKIASPLKPARDWLAFGITISSRSYRTLKFYKYGDLGLENKKPENLSYDAFCVGFMALADGILTCDEESMNMAWALWPEKRESIYRYVQTTHEVEVFEP